MLITMQQATIRCSQCGFTETVSLPPEEIEELRTTEKVRGGCPACLKVVDFNRVSIEVASGIDPNLVTVGYESYHLEPAPAKKRDMNERGHVRVTVKNVKACIRMEGRDDDIVQVNNLSRGGIAFASLAYYPVGAVVQIATHYTECGMNIFQPATILRQQFKPTQGVAGEYGARFAEKPKN